MPRRPFYRSIRTGKIVSPDDIFNEPTYSYVFNVERGGYDRAVVEQPPEEPIVDLEPTIFWQTEQTDRLLIWKDFAEDSDRDFAPFVPPEGVTQYRVFAYMNSDSTDERGIASSEWHKLTEWPPRPSWIGAHGAPQIDFVAFDRGSSSAES